MNSQVTPVGRGVQVVLEHGQRRHDERLQQRVGPAAEREHPQDQPGACTFDASIPTQAVKPTAEAPGAGRTRSRGHRPIGGASGASTGAQARVSSIEFGVGYFPTSAAVAPGPLARMVEEHGQGSLFFAEHTHIPVESIGTWHGKGPLPAKYWHCLDLFVSLTAAAEATSRLRIGSGICLVIERDPIITAKQVASVDYLSGGRFEFGVGAGWNRQEMRNHGTDPARRMTLMRERIEAMKAIWTQEEASYSGAHVSFERILSFPKPVQQPHPPILVGGSRGAIFDRVLAFGDAWFPTYAPGILERVGELRERARRPVDVQIIGVPADAAELERVRAAGVGRAVHWLPSGPLSIVERDARAVGVGGRRPRRGLSLPGGARAARAPAEEPAAGPPIGSDRDAPSLARAQLALDARPLAPRGDRRRLRASPAVPRGADDRRASSAPPPRPGARRSRRTRGRSSKRPRCASISPSGIRRQACCRPREASAARSSTSGSRSR